jgi:ketosteroid isomerase-like protein
MTYSVSRTVVDAFYKAYASHDTASITPLLHDDIEWNTSGPVDILSWCGRRRGKPAVVELLDKVFPSLFRFVSVLQVSLAVDGDRVATLNRLTVRRLADGRIISYRLAHFMRFKDDKLISNLSLIDTFDAVEQVLGHPLAVPAAAPPNSTGDLVAI